MLVVMTVKNIEFIPLEGYVGPTNKDRVDQKAVKRGVGER